MVKGDYHRILNNVGFNHTVEDNITNIRTQPDICIRQHEPGEDEHTLSANNGAQNFSVDNDSSDGCLYPLVGIAMNNIKGSVYGQLRDPDNFDFRPIPGSDYAVKGVGAYFVNDSFYWIPGRQGNMATFPIPKNYAIDVKYDKNVALIWRNAFLSNGHILRLYENECNSNSIMVDRKEFEGKNNVHELRKSLKRNTTYCWTVDVISDFDVMNSPKKWYFTTIF